MALLVQKFYGRATKENFFLWLPLLAKESILVVKQLSPKYFDGDSWQTQLGEDDISCKIKILTQCSRKAFPLIRWYIMCSSIYLCIRIFDIKKKIFFSLLFHSGSTAAVQSKSEGAVQNYVLSRLHRLDTRIPFLQSCLRKQGRTGHRSEVIDK